MRARLLLFLFFSIGCANSRSSFDEDAGDLPDTSTPDSGMMMMTMMDATIDTPVMATCSDMTKNGTESDIDCGGSCAPCADDKICNKPADCASGSCFAGHCGPRMWFAESTGQDIAVPGNQQWIAAQGTSIKAMLWAPSLVYLRWNGTMRFAGGGNGICHMGQRFVIDGMPTGDATWGNAIMVQRGSTRWHEPFNLEMAVMLPMGMHTFSTEIDNANGYATCNLDGDMGALYDRSRLVAIAFDPQTSWYAESSGSTGGLGPNSGWTDIPGAALAIPLASNSHVQFSMQGSEYVGQPYGHCAYRFVLDGNPLGDPNHGQAIAVGDGGGGWWAPVAIVYGQDLASGMHSIKAQMRNSSVAGSCDAGKGNDAYARFHLLATASPQMGFSQSFESTGGPQIFSTGSQWTAIAGLQTSFNLGGATPWMMIDVAGTQRTVSGSGHCAYRLVIDGTPLGEINHGQTIDVGDIANTWWTYTGIGYAQKFSTGLHQVSVEARNSGNSGDCGVNGDGQPYGRVRMLLRAL